MLGIVTFDPTAFVARYPEFSAMSAPALAMYFDEATIYLDNTPTSAVADVSRRAVMLNMLTALIAALNGNGKPSGQVGRVSSASEGSVSAQLAYAAPSGTRAWYDQTQYGASFWAATRSLRTMRYFAPRGR